MNKRNRFLKVFIVILAVLIVAVIIVIVAVQSWLFGEPKKLANQTANIYAFGDGTNMKELIAPGYVESYEEKSQVLGVSDVQNIYIDNFRNFASSKVGSISDIECEVTAVMAVSNIEDFAQQFADNGVLGVTEYRRVSADWTVTGDDGEYTMSIEMYVLKCDDGWYVDYVQLPEEAEEAETSDDTAVEDAETTDEADDETVENSDDVTVEDTQTDGDTTETDAETTDDGAEAD